MSRQKEREDPCSAKMAILSRGCEENIENFSRGGPVPGKKFFPTSKKFPQNSFFIRIVKKPHE